MVAIQSYHHHCRPRRTVERQIFSSASQKFRLGTRKRSQTSTTARHYNSLPVKTSIFVFVRQNTEPPPYLGMLSTTYYPQAWPGGASRSACSSPSGHASCGPSFTYDVGNVSSTIALFLPVAEPREQDDEHLVRVLSSSARRHSLETLLTKPWTVTPQASNREFNIENGRPRRCSARVPVIASLRSPHCKQHRSYSLESCAPHHSPLSYLYKISRVPGWALAHKPRPL